MAKLITFGISHYCEKTRWALDWYGIRYDEVGWPPGMHITLARRLRAPRSTLPILVDGDQVIQGSEEIVDWAGRNPVNDAPTLDLPIPTDEALSIVRRANRELGVQVRRLFYAEVLTDHPALAKPWLLLNTSRAHRLVGNVTWPVVRRVMMQAMDARPAAAADSRARVEAELDWLDELVRDRSFLVGDRFSRVDLTVASLLAPFARPSEAGVYSAMKLPPALADDVARWQTRPSFVWVKRIYAGYRRALRGRRAGPSHVLKA